MRHHHENWDGSGYPDGLKGEAIPLGARILSVVDCFDALTSDRPYRRQLSRHVALDIVRSRRGIMYDPLVVDKFLELYTELEVAQKRDAVETGEVDDSPVPHLDAATIPPRTAGASGRSRLLAGFVDALHRRGDAIPRDALLVVYRRDPSTDTLVAYCVSSREHDWIRRVAIKLGDAVSGWVGANQRGVLNADPLSDFQGAANHGRVFRSCVGTPVEVDGLLVGVLSIYSSRRSAFNERSETIAQTLASDIALDLHPSSPTRHEESSEPVLV